MYKKFIPVQIILYKTKELFTDFQKSPKSFWDLYGSF